MKARNDEHVTTAPRISSDVDHEIADDITTVTLDEVDLPAPGPGEVQVKIMACAVNFPDILMIQGRSWNLSNGISADARKNLARAVRFFRDEVMTPG